VAEGDDKVLVALKPDHGRDSILNIAGQPILSAAYFASHDFSRAGMEAPLGSGAYKIGAFEQGRYIAFHRVADYWGKDLPVNRGQNNFDVIRFDYFGERAVGFEGVQSGQVICTRALRPRRWATGYDFPALRDGRVSKQEFPDRRSPGFQVFSSICAGPFQGSAHPRGARPVLDFEWSNRNLFYGAYKRAASYFENTEMRADGPPRQKS